MHIIQGWLDQATRQTSPNFAKGYLGRDMIVLHYTASYTAASAINSFKSKGSKASAHFIVDIDGGLTQMVSCLDTAWHAGGGQYAGKGQINQRSIGIEIVNPGYHFKNSDGQYLDWQRKVVPAQKLLPFQPLVEARDPWVGSAQQYWPSFPEKQLHAIEQLIRSVKTAFPQITDICTHKEVDSLRKLKVDPGPAFPMDRFRPLAKNVILQNQKVRVHSPASPLNIRTGPGIQYASLANGPLPDQHPAIQLEIAGNWAKLRTQKAGATLEGWCNRTYLVPDATQAAQI